MVIVVVVFSIIGLAWAGIKYFQYRRWLRNFAKKANRRRGIS